jgi:glycosyltransferase involved in cell wall biosynthesis
MISIVVPVYNEEKTVQELHRRILNVAKNFSDAFEIIFVNDGSTDQTEKIVAGLHPIKLISFEKNCGQTSALNAGIRNAKGDIVIFLDADLQNPPEEIPKFLEKINNGCDVVVGWRQNRQDSWYRLVFSKVANAITRLFLGVKIHDFGCGLKAYRRKFIKDFDLWGQMQVFLPAIAKARGAKVCEVIVAHEERKAGSSKIKVINMLKAGFNLFKVFIIVRFMNPYRTAAPAYIIKSRQENV